MTVKSQDDRPADPPEHTGASTSGVSDWYGQGHLAMEPPGAVNGEMFEYGRVGTPDPARPSGPGPGIRQWNAHLLDERVSPDVWKRLCSHVA
eukprot:scaffold105606_cov51-Prasinocladus_malaysianus.AAC.2